MKLLSLLALSSIAVAKWVHYDETYYTVAGCKGAITSDFTFCKKADTAKTYKCICSSEDALASWLYCSYDRTEKYDAGVDSWISTLCKNYTSTELHAIYDKGLKTIVDVGEVAGFNSSKILKTPAYDSRKKFEKLFLNNYYGFKNRFGNVNVSHYLGIAFVAATFLVFFIAGLANWFTRFSNTAHKNNGIIARTYKKYIQYSILGKHLNSTKFGLTPDTLETILISIMFIYTILTNFILGFSYYQGDTTFKTAQAGYSRYYGDRSCILLSYKLPLLFIFPGRNNFIQAITRWHYSRFVTFHKWLARIVVMEVIVHSCAMASQTYALKNVTRIHTDWYIYGIVSTVCCGFIILCALYPIRKIAYDVFKVVHVVLIVMMIWTAFLHAKSQGYEAFYWACIAIWIFEYLVRAIRIVTCGGLKKVTVQYYQDGTLKLSVPTSYGLSNAKPGSHAFIYFMGKQFFQSHCFTICPSVENSNEINFFCRVKKGITSDIAKLCTEKPITLNVLIEGVYGVSNAYQHFDKSVFVTAGTGVVGPFGHALKLAEAGKSISFYWSVRTLESAEWFKDHLSLLKSKGAEVTVHVSQHDTTSTTSSSDNDQSSEKHLSDTESVKADFAEIKPGRMDIDSLIDSEISSIQHGGSIAFGACAHPAAVDHVRSTVSKKINSDVTVAYFEEMQMW